MNTVTSPSSVPSQPVAGAPWWRFPIVWMVIAGPLAVVVASLFTVGIAVTHVDPVLQMSAADSTQAGHAPAVQGRNRAAETAMQPTDH